jgi:hypothetical protein
VEHARGRLDPIIELAVELTSWSAGKLDRPMPA